MVIACIISVLFAIALCKSQARAARRRALAQMARRTDLEGPLIHPSGPVAPMSAELREYFRDPYAGRDIRDRLGSPLDDEWWLVQRELMRRMVDEPNGRNLTPIIDLEAVKRRMAEEDAAEAEWLRSRQMQAS